MTVLDKGKWNKNEYSNFRQVSVWSTFSKIYKRFIKGQIISSTEKYLLTFLSVHIKNYSLLNTLISLTEECRKNLGNNFVVGVVLFTATISYLKNYQLIVLVMKHYILILIRINSTYS